MELELQGAVQLKDRERIIRVTIKLKDLFFVRIGDSLVFHKCPKLEALESLRKRGFFGLAFNKEKIAQGFSAHSPHPIHTALTRGLPA